MKIVLKFGRASKDREPRRFSINFEETADYVTAYVKPERAGEPLTPGEEFCFGDLFTISFHSAEPRDLPGGNRPRRRAGDQEYIDADYRVVDKGRPEQGDEPDTLPDLKDYFRTDRRR